MTKIQTILLYLTIATIAPLHSATINDLPIEVLEQVSEYLLPPENVHHFQGTNLWLKKSSERVLHKFKVRDKKSTWSFFNTQEKEIRDYKFANFDSFITHLSSQEIHRFLAVQKNLFSLEEKIRKSIRYELSALENRMRSAHQKKSEFFEKRHLSSIAGTLITLDLIFKKSLHDKQIEDPIFSIIHESHLSDLIWGLTWTDDYELFYPWEEFFLFKNRTTEKVDKSESVSSIHLTDQNQWEYAEIATAIHFLNLLKTKPLLFEKSYFCLFNGVTDAYLPPQSFWASEYFQNQEAWDLSYFSIKDFLK